MQQVNHKLSYISYPHENEQCFLLCDAWSKCDDTDWQISDQLKWTTLTDIVEQV